MHPNDEDVGYILGRRDDDQWDVVDRVDVREGFDDSTITIGLQANCNDLLGMLAGLKYETAVVEAFSRIEPARWEAIWHDHPDTSLEASTLAA